LNIENWEHNRPPDEMRIPEIANDIRLEKYILGMIYIYKDKNENYYCYDGIHRIKALEYLDKNNNLKEKFIILNYINNGDTSKVINNFKKINKTIPVPELYTKDSIDLNLRKTLSEICQYYQKKYPSHFSTSRKPRLPNENRDNLFDILYGISQDCHILLNYNSQQWISLLDNYNIYMKDHINSHKLANKQILTNKQFDKCNKTNCYLFCSKNTYLYLSEFIIQNSNK
jgi:hypothetical protein